jgi:hypothetical protein
MLAVGAFASAASAEHEVSSRYTVLGYVTDARGRPLDDQRVELIRRRTGLSYVSKTDEQGLYIIVARLGDESVGEALIVKIGRAATTVTARFEPANRTDERGTRVDGVSGKLVERRVWFPSTLRKVLGAK